MAVADREFPRAAAAVHCGRDPLRVVWRTRRAATLAGATEHGSWVNRRLQDLKPKPFSELDHETVGIVHDRGQRGAVRCVISACLWQTLQFVIHDYDSF